MGNEVYRDTTGIYFTFPDIDLPADLAQEICRRVEGIEMELAPRVAVEGVLGTFAGKQLTRILADQRERARRELARPFAPENLAPDWRVLWEDLPSGRWEVCPVCRLRPMKEGTEACGHCLDRRRSRIQTWLREPRQTIWMDEIADHNGRVALLVGKFGLEDWLSGDLVQTMLVKAEENNPAGCIPKNPSPARLRRVWKTCWRFWTETVEGEILAKHTYGEGVEGIEVRSARLVVIPDEKSGWEESVPYDGTVGGRAFSLLWREDGRHFLTISNLQLAAGDTKDASEFARKLRGRQVVVADPVDPRLAISFVVQGAVGETDAYAPYLSLPLSPGQFLAFVPAHDALAVAERVYSEYGRQFGKVRNRLPLFLGLVFFQRKTPLTAVMDVARRMLETPLHKETWELQQDPDDGRVEFTNGVRCTVPVTMGDGSEDRWHPYFFVEEFADGTSERRARRFQHNGRWLVHVNDLRRGDRVFIVPSRFAYFYLESTAQRFRFDPERDVLLLDDLQRLTGMWEELRRSPDMSQTKLQAIQALFHSKWQLWRLAETQASEYAKREETFLQLVETTLKRDRLQGVSASDVVSGLFHHCLELHLHILKRKVKEAEDERQATTV